MQYNHRPDLLCHRTISGPEGLFFFFFSFLKAQVKRSHAETGGRPQSETDLGGKRECVWNPGLRSKYIKLHVLGSKKIDWCRSFLPLVAHSAAEQQQIESRWGDTDLVLVFILRLCSFYPRSWQRGAQRARWGVPTEGWFCDKQSVVLVVFSLAEITTLWWRQWKTGSDLETPRVSLYFGFGRCVDCKSQLKAGRKNKNINRTKSLNFKWQWLRWSLLVCNWTQEEFGVQRLQIFSGNIHRKK